ncbi:glycosyltransferase family 2 protein [Frigidibacter sp.]|uniref:glycosyltransferase family 2 protein n=1 Tax=Frigidibacter sp. TaxID=2586418 RepID=UPI00273343FD|nr:glycosyltransferase family 2 protein [Frigidibacter sp.]MDP3340996.1 glycosyltransferase family 2 protein [Frigidibacter sp.]
MAETSAGGIIDATKAPGAAVTMVKNDHFFLRRWLAYYGGLLGRENLYVLSHGNDPEIREIAAGANVINVPYDATRTKFDRRRWELLSNFTNGLLRYHNWVICGDVDEVVLVDPLVAPDLLTYLNGLPRRQVPQVACPLGLEIIHNPDLEPEPLEDGATVLSRRRLFRLNANYSKPCITRVPLMFSPGGHSCSINKRGVDPNLYLIHMRFVSHDITLARLESRRQMKVQEAETTEGKPRRSIWERDAESFLKLSKLEPVAETVDFAEFRTRMVEEKREVTPGGHWFFGGGRSKELYRLPERFTGLV